MSSTVERSAVVGIALFAGLGERDATVASRRLRSVAMSPRQVLFREGDPADTVYVLVAGELDVLAAGDDGAHRVARLEPGSILGHLGLLTHESRSATVIAHTQAELWETTSDAFHDALEAGEVWAGRFLLAAACQLALIMGSANKRVVSLIEQVARAPGQPADRVAELEELRSRLVSEWAF
ncbi:MAG: cyclic nucleotide-binding domain-containing protein [Acidimicrobiales bacterium]